jgi:hypothetical protein
MENSSNNKCSDKTSWLAAAIIYASFFAAIAVACAVTKSGWCLLALFATPSIKIGGDSAK